MFKSLFIRNNDKELIKATEIAFEGKSEIDEMFEQLSLEGIVELYMFNIVYCWIYFQENSIVEMNVKNAERFLAISFIKAKEIKSLDIETYMELFKNRFINHSNELHRVKDSQSLNNNQFPIYFHRRIFFNPLTLDELPELNERDKGYYEDSILLSIYTHQTDYLQTNLIKFFR